MFKWFYVTKHKITYIKKKKEEQENKEAYNFAKEKESIAGSNDPVRSGRFRRMMERVEMTRVGSPFVGNA